MSTRKHDSGGSKDWAGAPRRRSPVWLLLALFDTGCRAFLHPLPAGAAPLEPPVEYRAWWNDVAQCSGLSRPFDAVRWFVVPSDSIPVRGEYVGGFFQESRNWVVLTQSNYLHGPIVRHEMLHALMGHVPDSNDHPRLLFVNRCGDEVDCQYIGCPTDAPPVPADVPHLPPESLKVRVAVDTMTAQYEGWEGYAVTVTATNPANHPVFVPLQRLAHGRKVLISFEWQIDSVPFGHSAFTGDSAVGYFRAGETKRQRFEIAFPELVLEAYAKPLIFRGAFGGYWAEQGVPKPSR